jgi:uncharacterized protein YyaL (SSP411 family)
MNELHLETSPYLLQHAKNPIYWKAWNDKTLALAKEQNKLIVLSVGYSACHWCHVMEHESFEDEEVAQVMNEHYISIKVDREERPDIDSIYMKAVQLMTGQGGWPMNVVLLPDGKPVWGGTFFRKNNWIDALQQLQQLNQNEPAKVYDYAEKLLSGIQAMELVSVDNEAALPTMKELGALVTKWAKSFDKEYGGYARAPKFMMPNNYLFLQRYGYQTQNNEILDFVDLTLTRMSWGGLFDTIGGGFSRYSVDMRWHVPHFEKMLYDNGQLLSLYSEAYKRTQKPLYKEVVEKTHEFIKAELTMENGAFYSALDADSMNKDGKQEEGAFYVWQKDELERLLKEDYEIFSAVYNINEFGYWEHKNYVLIQTRPLEEIANTYHITFKELKLKKQGWEKLLYNERKKRHSPGLDDKVLTSWNALMLKGYADSYKAFQKQEYIDAAIKNAEFIVKEMWHADGFLWRTYKNDKAKIKGFLEDYAHTIDAFITLYEATLHEQWLLYAKQLADYCLDNFYDEKKQFFAYNQVNEKALIAAHYETEDNVIPASNSVMANALFKLGILFENSHYENRAKNMLRLITPNFDYASAFSNWLNLWLSLSGQNRELAICGTNAAEAAKQINSLYIPHVLLAGCTGNSPIPFLKGGFVKNSLMFYVCKNKACNLPVYDADEAVKQLKINIEQNEF